MTGKMRLKRNQMEIMRWQTHRGYDLDELYMLRICVMIPIECIHLKIFT